MSHKQQLNVFQIDINQIMCMVYEGCESNIVLIFLNQDTIFSTLYTN